MVTKNISVVFFGTGPVAAKSLQLLVKNFEVEAVITKPKPAHHRGNFPVLDVANNLGLKIYEVTDKKSLSELIAKTHFNSRVGVLIDFGIIVSQSVIDSFEKGIVNSHFSLLPEWRGADPITFSVLSGQKKTGVSLMLLVEKMDEGPLLFQTPIDISSDDTTKTLTEKLIQESNKALVSILPLWLNDEKDPGAQEEVTMASSKTPSYSRKLTKKDGELDFSKSANELEREVRAFADWPKSRTTIGNIDVIITKAHAVPSNGVDSKPGNVGIVDEANEIGITTSNGTLWIDKLKPAGKNEMLASEFIRGYRERIK